MCGSCGARIVYAGNATGYVNQIPLQEVVANSTKAKFKWFYCISPEQVNNVFSVVKVNGTEPLRVNSMSDMERLADYHEQGLDKKNYNQDFWALLSTINFTPEELSKSECSTALTY